MERRRLWITLTVISIAVIVVGVGTILSAAQVEASATAPVLALGGLIAIFGIALALRCPDVAVVLLIAADAAKMSEIAADLIGVGVFQPLLGLAMVSMSLAVISGRLRLQWSLLYLFAIAVAAASAASVLVAGGSEAGIEALVEFAKDLAYLVVVLAWATSRRSWRLATGVLVGTMAMLGALSVVQEFALGNGVDFFGLSNVQTTQLGAVTLRHSGPEVDANFWARSLALTLPIALSWWAVSKRAIGKWLAAGAVIGIGLGLYLTQSRGGLLAVTMAVIIWLILAGRRYVRLLALAPVALAIILVIPGVGSRLVTLTEIGEAQQGAGDPSLQGRVGAQEAGIGMFLANPVLGVGLGEFRLTVPETQRDLGIQAEVLDAHNLFLEIAAESGFVGLSAWALFLGFGVFAAMRVLMLSRQQDSEDGEWNRLMAAGIVSGIAAWLAASVFLHAASLRVLFTVLAVGVGMDIGLRGSSAELSWGTPQIEAEPSRAVALSPAPARPRPPVIQRPLVAGALVFLVVAVGGWLVVGDAPQDWVAERQLVVTTGEEASGPYAAYSQDLISRGLIGATYAAVLEDPKFTLQALDDLGWTYNEVGSTEVSAAYSPSLQIISVRVVGDDAAQVAALAAGVARRGAEFVGGLAQPFIVDDVGPSSMETQPTGLSVLSRAALLAIAATAAAVAAIGIAGVAHRNRDVSSQR